MLSNPPPSGLHARQQRQHRRQNSTPTAYEAVKIAPNLPNIQPSPLRAQPHQQQRARVSHRRGMSLDTRRQMLAQRRQEYDMVSHTNNSTGSANTPQHVVREAQQQRIARPGPQQAHVNLAADETYLVSPGATPQMPCFDEQWSQGLPMLDDASLALDMYNGPMNVVIKKNQNDFTNSSLNGSEFDLFPSSAMSTPTMMDFPDNAIATPGWMSDNETASLKKSSRRISNGIMDRVSKFENMSGEPFQRPLTPPRQNEADYYPLTPMETPHSRTFKQAQPPQRFAEGYDESNEETVKPVRQRTNRRSQTVFDEMRQATEALEIIPETRRANTMPTAVGIMPTSASASEYLTLNETHSSGLHIDTNGDGFHDISYPVSSSSEYSGHISPATPCIPEFQGFDFAKSQLDAQIGVADMLSDVPSSSSPMSLSRASQHRRTESVASLASAASIAGIDIENTKTATGITLEDIQQYIRGPDPKDNKWICVFEDCNKKFGRKENIKSHVQTHLNDRQFQCPSCQKCFVRQHDLKRHAKIHTGIKPYPCLCGNSFARHDALTRHRQRGMCIGAFEGSAPKNAKRGRPRKPRPDDDERREKAIRTRRKNNKSISSVSSQGTCSDGSAATSPEDYHDFDLLDDIMDVSLGGTTMNPSNLQSLGSSSAPMPTLAMDAPLSAHSPSTASLHSYASPLSQATFHSVSTAETLPPHPGSPGISAASTPNDPPELSHASSPPATQYFDAEPSSNGLDLMISTGADASAIGGLLSMDSNGNELLLECDSQMLMFGSEAKFDDSYDGVDMFTNNDDLLFGHS
ncbi:hypothetical protein F5Y14DRAFT_429102 [Nemania sp. NC0429]|nr:hypothetical protein F5Y14DRAFT_429102 [Nemania sp. NC0429]